LQTVRLFCQDESRYGLLSVISRRITLPGIKPIAKVDDRYESVYLYGAVEPRTGERFFFELSHLTADCFQIFLNKFSETFPESLNLLVLDNGRFHRAKSLEIPENVVLLFLPPYSPELNPIERLWQDIKAKLFSQTYKTFEDMQAKVTEILLNYSDATMAKLTGFSYFINTANAI
jgi:transposase